jgi:predicted hydrolase (HD superfamily)
MRALPRRLGEDQDRTGEDSKRHAYLAADWLRDAGVEEPVVNAVLATPTSSTAPT